MAFSPKRIALGAQPVVGLGQHLPEGGEHHPLQPFAEMVLLPAPPDQRRRRFGFPACLEGERQRHAADRAAVALAMEEGADALRALLLRDQRSLGTPADQRRGRIVRMVPQEGVEPRERRSGRRRSGSRPIRARRARPARRSCWRSRRPRRARRACRLQPRMSRSRRRPCPPGAHGRRDWAAAPPSSRRRRGPAGCWALCALSSAACAVAAASRAGSKAEARREAQSGSAVVRRQAKAMAGGSTVVGSVVCLPCDGRGSGFMKP